MSQNVSAGDLLFIVEYYDPLPMITKRYQLKYFGDSHAVEMVDIQKKKLFLKKSPCPPEVSASDFVLGAKLFLYSRELLVVEYGDRATRERLERQTQKCIALISSDLYQDWGKIVAALETEMTLVKLRTVIFNDSEAESFLAMTQGDPKLKESLTRGTNLSVLFQSERGCEVMNEVVRSLGTGDGVVVARDEQQTNDISQTLLTWKSTATLDNCTCCVVRPHAVKEKVVGGILKLIIDQGYEVSALDSFQFDKAASEEFLEVYKGVVPEYPDHVVQLSSGLSVCMELRAENAVEVFRETAGPWDIDMAKALRPNSIRGKYGHDKVRSAVHCTDVAQDAQLECEYCFEIMQKG